MVGLEDAKIIASGKTKIIKDAGGGKVYVCNKDDITAGDGEKRDNIKGKGETSTRITSNVFELLEKNGIETHYICKQDPTTFLAKNLTMIPLEFVVRRVATGSYLERNREVADGTIFEDLVFEIFEKDDKNHDPLIIFDFKKDTFERHNPKLPKNNDSANWGFISTSRFQNINHLLMKRLKSESLKIFTILEDKWKEFEGTLFDLKIEFGVHRLTNKIMLGDVIDSDSWRLRFNGEAKDKQAYRDGTKSLADIVKDFAEVADMTDGFNS